MEAAGIRFVHVQKCPEVVAQSNLGKYAKDLSSLFTCGGKLEPQKIDINYTSTNSGKITKITLPGADEAALSKLLSASSVASFGKGTKQLTDPSYCDAFKIDPDMFMTSFHPGSTTILSDIETVMLPNQSIRAELHKLNLYTGPGSHFKSHVDTPRSGDMFGSLVVCLPTRFTGGVLVTRHGGKEVAFDWSSTPDHPTKEIQWAAFFSDVEHEILPVTSGHRITLTYNLYSVTERPTTIATNTKFYEYLRETLSTPNVLRKGGCLGLDCRHMYAFNMLNEKELLPHVLKGADYMVFSAAKALGLRVTVRSVVEGEDNWYVLPEFSNKLGIEGDTTESTLESLCDEPPVEVLCPIIWCIKDLTWRDVFAHIKKPVSITPTELERKFNLSACRETSYLQEKDRHWLSKQMKKLGIKEEEISTVVDALIAVCPPRWPAGVYSYYGNDAMETDICYQSAAILIEVPHWGHPTRVHILTLESQSSALKEEDRVDASMIFESKNLLSCQQF